VVAAAEFIGNPCVLQCDYWMALNYIVFSFTRAWEVTLMVSSTSLSWDNEWPSASEAFVGTYLLP